MTGREKMEAAFSEQGTAEIPVVTCYHGIFLRDHWDLVTDQPWWAFQDGNVNRAFAVYRDMHMKLDEDWFVLPTGPSYRERERFSIEERSEGVYRLDRWIGTAVPLERPTLGGWPVGGGLIHVKPDRPITSRQQIEAKIPLGDEPDYRAPWSDGRADLTAMILKAFGKQSMPLSHVPSALWRCYGIWGFEGMMTALVDTPDLVTYACERFTEEACRMVKQSAALGSRCIWIEECLTDMINADHFAQFNLPYLQRIVDEIRSQGMYSVYYYCGSPAGKWNLLLHSGADALSLEESKKGFTIDIADVVDRVQGKMTVLGNLDALTLLESGTDEELRAEIARQIEHGRRNDRRFIMSIGSPVTPGTPVQRVRRYLDLTRQLGSSHHHG